MFYFGMLAIAVGLGLPIAVLSAAMGQAKVGASAMEGIARQPEASGKIQLSMMIALGFIESLVIYALLMFFILQGRLPATADILRAISR